MKTKQLLVLLLLALLCLTGCGSMYPADEISANKVPDVDQLAAVQRAINEFRADTGVLPIKTRDMDTDIFIKYLIDFEKLVPKYIANAPANSYEKGGIYQYIIWDPENNPTVKLVDLHMPERMREVNIRFMSTTYPQYKEKVADFIYTIDYTKIGFKEDISVKSPYSDTQLPILITTEGNMIVDYSIDLNNLLKEMDTKPKPGEDLRLLLVEKYPVVPAYSVPYTINGKNEPVFMYDPVTEK